MKLAPPLGKPGKMATNEPLAVRIPQAARMIGIAQSTLYQYIALGEIEIIKIGRCTVVPTDTLRDFIERRRKARG